MPWNWTMHKQLHKYALSNWHGHARHVYQRQYGLCMVQRTDSRTLSDRCEDLQRSYWTESRTFKDLIGQMQGPSRILLDWIKDLQGSYRTDARTFKDLTGLNQGPSRILSNWFKDLQGSYWTESRTFKDLIRKIQGLFRSWKTRKNPDTFRTSGTTVITMYSIKVSAYTWETEQDLLYVMN